METTPSTVFGTRTTRGPYELSHRSCRMWAALAVFLVVAIWASFHASAADVLNWRTNRNLVSADIQQSKLSSVLEQIAAVTSWEIFLEPGTSRTVSAKFKEVKPGEALRLLLADLNFAL